jgi:anaphase-promoting complex subunit 2
MDKVTNHQAVKNANIFNSVFTKPPLTPAAHAKLLTQVPLGYSHTIDAQTLQVRLFGTLEPLLGIGLETYVYGREQFGGWEPFQLPLSKCAPMSQVRPANRDDATFELRRMMRSTGVWKQLVEIRQHLGLQRARPVVAATFRCLLGCYVIWAYADKSRDDVTTHLEFWVRNVYQQVLNQASSVLERSSFAKEDMEPSHIDRWCDMAMTRLGELRVQELMGAIRRNVCNEGFLKDLRMFLTNSATRTYLTTEFLLHLEIQAMQPAASTIEILRLHIAVIRIFRVLDPKGVLLDRIARRVRKYLRDREDTVKVIVTGLLSETTGSDSVEDPINTLTEIADELHRKTDGSEDAHSGELDWDNMQWTPDPIDAAPDYMKSVNTDVIGSLTSLFDSKEMFVKELQSVLAERLLQHKDSYAHEVAVLERLKARFGDSALQSCEVMLKDVLDSRKIDSMVNSGPEAELRNTQNQSLPTIHTKILSRLFWPSVSDQSFTLPETVRKIQHEYEQTFASVKESRQLTWVPSLGQIDVEIELEDRKFREAVLPYQATVIFAFQDARSTSSSQQVSDLAEKLSMSSILVRSACIFWVSRHVLAEEGVDSYVVLETLPDGEEDIMTGGQERQDASAAAAEAAAAQAAREAEDEERKQKMAMYHQFIVSMLTNQGAMPLQRIAMMLGIVVPGGFPFSNDELKEFLTGMVKEGRLEVGPGGNYKAVA